MHATVNILRLFPFVLGVVVGWWARGRARK
jgi:hypothetical protein